MHRGNILLASERQLRRTAYTERQAWEIVRGALLDLVRQAGDLQRAYLDIRPERGETSPLEDGEAGLDEAMMMALSA